MRNILNIALNELKVSSRSRVSFILVLILPVFMIFIMGYAMKPVFEQNINIEKFPVLYVNHDGGHVGKAFDSMIKSQAYIEPVAGDEDNARTEVASGKYAAAILIPENLSSKLDSGDKVSIEVVGSGKDQVRESIVRSIVDSFINMTNTNRSIYEGYSIYALGADIQASVQRIENAGGIGDNDFIMYKPVAQPASQSLSSFQYFTLSMLLFFMLTIGIGVGSNIVNQRSLKLYSRINSYPVKKGEYLMGMVLSNIMMSLIQVAVVILFTSYVFKVDWGNKFAGIGVIIILAILISSAIGIIFSGLVKSSKTLNSGMVIIIWLMAFASGGFSPIPALKPIGDLTFYSWAFDSLTNFMSGGGFVDVINNIILLSAAAVTLWVLAIVFYNRRVSNE